MKKSINFKTEELKQKLMEVINVYNLPVVNVYYVVQNLLRKLEDLYYNELQKQQQILLQQQKQKQEEKTEETDGRN